MERLHLDLRSVDVDEQITSRLSGHVLEAVEVQSRRAALDQLGTGTFRPSPRWSDH